MLIRPITSFKFDTSQIGGLQALLTRMIDG